MDSNISWGQRFFIFCSGASIQILKQCPEFERIKFVSIGITIFFTAVLAFLSSFYALSIIFENPILVSSIAVFWSLVIFNLDRYIVQSIRNDSGFARKLSMSIPRLMIAVLIAVVVSKPMEIKLFENEIQNFLMLEKKAALGQVDLKYRADKKLLTQKKSSFRESLNQKLELRNKYFEDYMCECNGTCGTKIPGWGKNCTERKKRFESYSDEYEQEVLKTDLLIREINRELSLLQNTFDSEKHQLEASLQFGFFDRVRALDQLDHWGAYFIMMIFIMIETAPVLTKLLSNKGPYDHLLMESEFEFETQYLRRQDFNLYQRKKSKQLNELSIQYELSSEESQLKDIHRAQTLERYDKIRIKNAKKNLN